mmetsp:Transcript_26155/g.60415  ORF Transcript_26155/g.60415 Transcript_26155/m.60415 type:complete len:256 (-) Transcript_26155:220-987(-)
MMMLSLRVHMVPNLASECEHAVGVQHSAPCWVVDLKLKSPTPRRLFGLSLRTSLICSALMRSEWLRSADHDRGVGQTTSRFLSPGRRLSSIFPNGFMHSLFQASRCRPVWIKRKLRQNLLIQLRSLPKRALTQILSRKQNVKARARKSQRTARAAAAASTTMLSVFPVKPAPWLLHFPSPWRPRGLSPAIWTPQNHRRPPGRASAAARSGSTVQTLAFTANGLRTASALAPTAATWTASKCILGPSRSRTSRMTR